MEKGRSYTAQSYLGWRDSSVSKVHAIPKAVETNGHGHMLAIPVVARLRPELPWGSLASQSRQIGELQANESPCLKKGGWHS